MLYFGSPYSVRSLLRSSPGFTQRTWFQICCQQAANQLGGHILHINLEFLRLDLNEKDVTGDWSAVRCKPNEEP